MGQGDVCPDYGADMSLWLIYGIDSFSREQSDITLRIILSANE